MWDKIWDYTKRVATLTRQTEENTKAITDIREALKKGDQEDKALNEKMNRVTEVLQRIGFEFQRDREKAETERQMQLLRLENTLLRSDRRALSGETLMENENGTLREQMQSLQRENEELRKRLEALEQK